ncbi:MAG: hypothetical protein HY261_05665 [Chloroflexi bacterium]|nr:hypothetical protein [Chloroflexota bacterium]
MQAFFALVIGLLVLAVVLAPFVLKSLALRHPDISTGNSQVRDLLDQRDTLLRSLAELEYDRSLGNVSETDYRRMRADYELQGVALLKALDERSAGLADEIDREVSAERTSRSGNQMKAAVMPANETEHPKPSGRPAERGVG